MFCFVVFFFEGGGRQGCSKSVLSSVLCFHPVWKWEKFFTFLVSLDLCNNDLVSFDRHGNVHAMFKIIHT